MGALLNREREKGGRLLLLHFPYRMSDKIAIKSDPRPFLNLEEKTDFFLTFYRNSPHNVNANALGTQSVLKIEIILQCSP